MAKISDKFLKRMVDPDAVDDERPKINYFRLVDDKDKAKVTFLYSNEDEIGESTRRVHLFKYEKSKFPSKVDCLREDSIDDCPMCEDEIITTNRIFINLYNHDTEQVEVWERGMNEWYLNLIDEMKKEGDLTKVTYEITRHGRKGNKRTTYVFDKVGENKKDMTEHKDSVISLDKQGSPVWHMDANAMVAAIERNPEQQRWEKEDAEEEPTRRPRF